MSGDGLLAMFLKLRVQEFSYYGDVLIWKTLFIC